MKKNPLSLTIKKGYSLLVMLHKRYSFGSAPLDMLLHLCSIGYAPAMSKFHLDSGHVRFTFRLYLLFVFQLYSVGCSIYILPMF